MARQNLKGAIILHYKSGLDLEPTKALKIVDNQVAGKNCKKAGLQQERQKMQSRVENCRMVIDGLWLKRE